MSASEESVKHSIASASNLNKDITNRGGTVSTRGDKIVVGDSDQNRHNAIVGGGGGNINLNLNTPLAAMSPNPASSDRESPDIMQELSSMRQREQLHVLKHLKEFFRDGRDKGEKSRNFAIYKKYVESVNDNINLRYNPKEHRHILYVNEEPLAPKDAAKVISNMIESLMLRSLEIDAPQLKHQDIPANSPSTFLPAYQSITSSSSSVSSLISAATQTILVDAKELSAFLKLVAEGEQDQAEAMLKRNPRLTHFPGDVTDLAKRDFKGITGFQYAIWALDWHMWTMIRKYLPNDKAAEQVQAIKIALWSQKHGVSASWQNLLSALQNYINLSKESKWSDAATQWNQQVGGAQRLLPAHVINEYCRPDRSFVPCPDFSLSTPLPRTCNTKGGEWYTTFGGKLGETFAYIRHSFNMPSIGIGGVMDVVWEAKAAAELKACLILLTTRTHQRDELFAELSNAHQVHAKVGR